MVRLGKETKQTPQEVLDKAVAFFGPGGAGLTLQQRSDQSVILEGGGGSVIVTASQTRGDRTEVDIVSREWDHQARQFLGSI
jgi:hypothetical protein